MQCEWQIEDNCPTWCWPHLLSVLGSKGWSQENILLHSQTTNVVGMNSCLLHYKGVDLAVLYVGDLQTESRINKELKVPFYFCFDDNYVRLHIVRTRRTITFRPCDFPTPEQLYLMYYLLGKEGIIQDLLGGTISGFATLVYGFVGFCVALLREISRHIASELFSSTQRAVYIDEYGDWYTNDGYIKRQLLQQLAGAENNDLYNGSQHEKRECVAIITQSEWLDKACDVLYSIGDKCRIIVVSNSSDVVLESSVFVDCYSQIEKLTKAKHDEYFTTADREQIVLDDFKFYDNYRNATMHNDSSTSSVVEIHSSRVVQEDIANGEETHAYIHIPEKRDFVVNNRSINIVNYNLNFNVMARKTSFEHQIELAESLKAYLHGFQERLGAVAKNYESKCDELYEAGMMDETHHDFEQNYMRETIISISKVVERINDCDIPFVERYIDELENLRESHSR